MKEERTTPADKPGADLPVGLGAPARRALASAGISTLEQVAAWPRGELVTLHGMGPTAVRLLETALREKGLNLG